MLSLTDLRGQRLEDYSAVLPRGKFDVEKAIHTVQPICEAVRLEGEAALRRFAEEFDRVTVSELRVPAQMMQDALDRLDPDIYQAVLASIERRRAVCQEIETEPRRRSIEVAPGARVENWNVPVERVGLYVPGGLAPLASSVVMNVVPALVAGVGSLAVATPPQAEFGGLPHPITLAVCQMLGVDEVYAVGGAQAIAMFTYGVPGLCQRADLVTGPGNIYVVAAKRYLRGRIGIDSEAGPTEIAILADDSADPAHLAADLISQAEHDPMAGSVLVTASEELISQVNTEISTQIEKLATKERLNIALSGPQSGAILVDDIDQAIAVVNDYAAEHLEIQTINPAQVADRVHNAGAIFLGPWSPVPLGDYCAGSTHVLPTGGAARYSSGLGVRSFMRAIQVIDYSEAALTEIGQRVQNFAQAENLPGHANAISVRKGV